MPASPPIQGNPSIMDTKLDEPATEQPPEDNCTDENSIANYGLDNRIPSSVVNILHLLFAELGRFIFNIADGYQATVSNLFTENIPRR